MIGRMDLEQNRILSRRSGAALHNAQNKIVQPIGSSQCKKITKFDRPGCPTIAFRAEINEKTNRGHPGWGRKYNGIEFSFFNLFAKRSGSRVREIRRSHPYGVAGGRIDLAGNGHKGNGRSPIFPSSLKSIGTPGCHLNGEKIRRISRFHIDKDCHRGDGMDDTWMEQQKKNPGRFQYKLSDRHFHGLTLNPVGAAGPPGRWMTGTA